jgi:hypothetical protein
MLNAKHVTNIHQERVFILEGTNWIAQKSILGIHGAVDDKLHEHITQIATIAMELTKKVTLASSKVVFDVGDTLNKVNPKPLLCGLITVV